MNLEHVDLPLTRVLIHAGWTFAVVPSHGRQDVNPASRWDNHTGSIAESCRVLNQHAGTKGAEDQYPLPELTDLASTIVALSAGSTLLQSTFRECAPRAAWVACASQRPQAWETSDSISTMFPWCHMENIEAAARGIRRSYARFCVCPGRSPRRRYSRFSGRGIAREGGIVVSAGWKRVCVATLGSSPSWAPDAEGKEKMLLRFGSDVGLGELEEHRPDGGRWNGRGRKLVGRDQHETGELQTNRVKTHDEPLS